MLEGRQRFPLSSGKGSTLVHSSFVAVASKTDHFDDCRVGRSSPSELDFVSREERDTVLNFSGYAY